MVRPKGQPKSKKKMYVQMQERMKMMWSLMKSDALKNKLAQENTVFERYVT
jgi:hypothetical protein